MSKSLQECVRLVREEYPDLYPYAYVAYQGGYVFNLLMKGCNPEQAISDFHAVNEETGEVSGSMPTMRLMKDPNFRTLWEQHAKLVSEEKVEHGQKYDSETACRSHPFEAPSGSSGRSGWNIRKNGQNDQNELTHHGIKGQEWGVRNGPPYPLDQKTHNAVVKGENKNTQAGMSEGQELAVRAAMLVGEIALFKAASTLITRTVKRVKQNRFTEDSKKISKELIGDISEHKEFSRENPPKKIQGEHSIDDDMHAVNPLYAGEAVPGTTNNCVLCSFTYDLRRRGYDVTAKPSNVGNYPDVLMTDLYEGAHADMLRGNTWGQVLQNAVKKYPEGARGVLGVYGPFGGGHEMAWEVHNGRVEIIDGQRNVRSSLEELKETGWVPGKAQFIRTDNLKVKMNAISKVASELKPDWKQTVREKNKNKVTGQNATLDDSNISTKSSKKMTKSEKREALEKLWKKEHKGTYFDAEARKSMDRWIDANMWSMYGHEGLVLQHRRKRVGWKVRRNCKGRLLGDTEKPVDQQYSSFLMHTDKEGGSQMEANGILGVYGGTLAHYGIKGQKHGVRRFQNEDGSLTPAGKERYGVGDGNDRPKGNGEDRNRKGRSNGMNGIPEKQNRKEPPESSKWKAEEAKDLSDAELNRRTQRLQRERQYQDLLNPKKNPNDVPEWKRDLRNMGKQALQTILVTTLVTPLAVVAARKWRFGLAKVRDWLHVVAKRPLDRPTNPETFFRDGNKKK